LNSRRALRVIGKASQIQKTIKCHLGGNLGGCYRPDYHWIKLPVFVELGIPRHEHGVVQQAPGLYFPGLHFQTDLTSALLGGVGEDAMCIVSKIS
jgi:hypothetical protein